MPRMLPRTCHYVVAGRLTVILACLVALPGCLTTMLWEDGHYTTEEVIEFVEEATGSLELADTGIVFGSSDNIEVWVKPLGPEGELAMALLADANYCEVLAAKLELTSAVRDAEVVEVDSTLEITVRLRPNVPAETVPELDVEPAIHAWMVRHLMTQPVGLHRAAVVLDEAVGERRRLPGATKIQATYVKCVSRYEQVEEEPLSIWAKIAFTPITLALDLALSAFWAWLTNDSDDENDHAEPRPTLSENPGESEQEWRARRHRIETGR